MKIDERKILHCDMNSFFCSVELLDFPEYSSMPVAIAGNKENRHGIILAKNEIAKSFGIITAETISSAKNKCKDLIILPPNHYKYVKFSKLINEIYLSYTDQVEPFSIDESWLDVTHSEKLFGSPLKIANEIRSKIKKNLGLTLSIGISYNKVFAKMGSEYKKPDAITIISKDNYKKLLWPLAVGDLFFVGKKTAEKLTSFGISTIGDLAHANPDFLKKLLGKHGIDLYKYSNGIDESQVKSFYDIEKPKSLGHGMTFKRNLQNDEDFLIGIVHLSDKVASRLRKNELFATCIKVEITDNNFNKFSKQMKLPFPTGSESVISKFANQIIKNGSFNKKEVRLLAITAINLVPKDSGNQLTLLEDINSDMQNTTSLDNSIDFIREKYGSKAIKFANILNNDLGIEDLQIDDE